MSPNLVGLESDFFKHVRSMVTISSLDFSLSGILKIADLKM